MDGRLFIITVIIAQTLLVVVTKSTLVKDDKEPCVYRTESGGVINLTSIAKPFSYRFVNSTGNTTGDATFKYTMYYNPCYDFDLPEELSPKICDNVAVCVKTAINDTETGYSNFGKVESLVYKKSTTVTLNYSNSKNETHVLLGCMLGLKSPYLDITSMNAVNNESNSLSMTLYSECACVDKCLWKDSKDDEGISTGSVLLIIFFVGVFVYLFGGMLFLRVVRGASGAESIPHYEFWADLPLAIRDGIVFTMNGCKTDAVYDRI